MDDLALARRKRRNDLLRRREASRQQRILEAQRIVPGQAYGKPSSPSCTDIPKQEPTKQDCAKLLKVGPSLDEPHAEGPIRYVLDSELTKASPSSSVSMSQSPETRPNHTAISSTTKKNIFKTDNARPHKRVRLLQPESDSSDGEDLFCFASNDKKKIDEPTNQFNTTAPAPSQKRQHGNPDGRKTEWIWEDLRSNSDESDTEAGQKVQVKKETHGRLDNGEESITKPARQHLDGLPQHQHEVAIRQTPSSAATPNKRINNPLVEAKVHRESAPITGSPAEINACSLWDDSDSDEGNEKPSSTALAPSDQRRKDLPFVKEPNDEQLRTIPYPSFERPKFESKGPPVPLILSDSYQVPSSINRYLGEYQQEGCKFLFEKAIAIQRGCILGDDMGLGKTVQTLALIAALLKKTGTEYDKSVLHERRVQADKRSRRIQFEKEKCLKEGRPFHNNETYGDVARELGLPDMAPIMVVAPKAVVSNWEETLMKWGHFAVVVYDGNRKRRELTIKGVENGIYEIVIVAYPTFQDQEKTASLKNGLVSWKLICIDEMHYCKNAKAEVTKNLRDFRDTHKSVVIGLTGTVMPNEHKELWNLIDLAAPDYLGEWTQFQENFATPMKLSRQRKATKMVIEFGQKQKLILDKLLQDILLRRDKSGILADKLPQKNECVVFCELSEMQALAYKHALTHEDFDILMKSNAPCDCGVNKKAKEDPQACIPGSAAYFKADLELSFAKAFLPRKVAKLMPGGYVRDSSILNQHDDLSGKFRYLGLILDKIERQNEKVLIFSNYTVPLDLIENFLEAKGYGSLRIDGSTCASRRKEIIAEFGQAAGAFILLLSKKAMGVGVTLTEANNVILFDVDWSPANDSQAQDRSYRIGQDRTVFVYRLVAKGTVEEMKYLRQLYKTEMTNLTLDEGIGEENQRGQFRGVQNDKYRKGELFGLENLLKYKEETFMRYKRNAALSQSHGFDIYDVGEILETMKATNANDGVLPFDDNAAVLEGFEQYKVNHGNMEVEDVDDEDDEAHLGMESQAAMEILDEAHPRQETVDEGVNITALLPAIEYQSTASMPSTESPPTSDLHYAASAKAYSHLESSSLTRAMPDNACSGELPPVSISAETTKATQKNSVASPVRPRIPTSTLPSPATSGQLQPDIVASGNFTLVGKTKEAIRRGEAGKTSFSRSDLPLPGTSNKRH